MNVSNLLLLFQMLSLARTEFRFTNIKCVSLDESFSRIDECFIKSVNRSYKYITIRAKMFQLPVTNITMDYALMRRENGYKPFLYSGTFDVCKFMRATNKNIVINYFYSITRDASNFNHTCPYDHDLAMEKLEVNRVNHYVTDVLPVPKGEYAFYSVFSFYNVKRIDLKVYGTLS